MPTDTTEKGLESLIMRHITGTDGLAVTPGSVAEKPEVTGTGYFAGSAQAIDRAHALDGAEVFAFLHATQPEAFKKLAMANANDAKDINRLKFLARLSSAISKLGVIAAKIQNDPYRFLICAEKFQTGYDEPLLHTRYVEQCIQGALRRAPCASALLI